MKSKSRRNKRRDTGIKDADGFPLVDPRDASKDFRKPPKTKPRKRPRHER